MYCSLIKWLSSDAGYHFITESQFNWEIVSVSSLMLSLLTPWGEESELFPSRLVMPCRLLLTEGRDEREERGEGECTFFCHYRPRWREVHQSRVSNMCAPCGCIGRELLPRSHWPILQLRMASCHSHGVFDDEHEQRRRSTKGPGKGDSNIFVVKQCWWTMEPRATSASISYSGCKLDLWEYCIWHIRRCHMTIFKWAPTVIAWVWQISRYLDSWTLKNHRDVRRV